ncbi:putative DNA repair endonuclease [Plasmodium gaboni]|uniref:Putative DNA repair endonuclease n=1 Tax=Plasmodium gaboni TaxID=647221 RepID=A0A151LWC7_9APIC|nr:putative DNA repair endonuclease [Plasmodium gaboni]KYO03494.1 putative DNA repair endonuclease [Plasmodium gaboni]
MGVKGLWSIVSPVGVRVNPEIFTGKRIAIDVSIWLYELTYANNVKDLRNKSFDNMSIFNDLWIDFSENISSELKTDNIKKAHLYFFFLRICKLLYYNIRPIFIFDGNPPELKRKTIFQRQIKKKNYEEKFKKTAEKLVYNYYQRTLLNSLKSKNKKNDNLNNLEDNINTPKKKTDTPNKTNDDMSKSSLLKIYDEIKEKDKSLNSLVENVGNVPVSVKDVLTICNDDLNKIKNKIFMITDFGPVLFLGEEDGHIDTVENMNKLDNKNEEENNLSYSINHSNIQDVNNNNDENKDNENYNKLQRDHKNYVNRNKKNTNIYFDDNEMEDKRNKNSLYNNDDIDEQIIRKKHMARKKYYESIPKPFKGFLCMRRPVDIIDISNYNTEMLEFSETLKVNENKFKQHLNVLDEKNRSPIVNINLLKDNNNNINKDVIEGEPKNGYINLIDVDLCNSSSSISRLENDENIERGVKNMLITNEDNSKNNHNNININMNDNNKYVGECSPEKKNDNGINNKNINILELPNNLDTSNLFLEGKDEYKVYYVNKEEIRIPLFKEINKDIFEKLPLKLQYQILQDIKEEWYTDNRIKAIKSKDDMDVFSQVQLETYVRMIKTDFEIEKLKIKMAENIQSVEGELLINKDLSKNTDNISIKDYNVIQKKKSKKKKKKFLNDILNTYNFNTQNKYQDLYVKGEPSQQDIKKNIYSGRHEIYRNEHIIRDTYDKSDIFRNIKKDSNKKNEIYKLQLDQEETDEKKKYNNKNNNNNNNNNNNESNKNVFLKIENEFKKDLLLDDRQIFGDSLLDDIKDYKNNSLNLDNNNETKILLEDRKEIIIKNDPIINEYEEKNKIIYISDEQKYNKGDIIFKDKNEKNNDTSSDDFENCSVQEKIYVNEDIEEYNNKNEDKLLSSSSSSIILEDVKYKKEKKDEFVSPNLYVLLDEFEHSNDVENNYISVSSDDIKPQMDKKKIRRVNETTVDKINVEDVKKGDDNRIIEISFEDSHISEGSKYNNNINNNINNNGDDNIYDNVDNNIYDNVDNNIYDNVDNNIYDNDDELEKKFPKDNISDVVHKNHINNTYIIEQGDVEKENEFVDNHKDILPLVDNKILSIEPQKSNELICIENKNSKKKFMSKEDISNVLIHKGDDINNLSKENYFEILLDKKQDMDNFHMNVEESHDKLKEDKLDEGAYFEYLEDNKILDSYIKETNKENEELIKEYKKLKKNNIEINDEMNDDIKLLLNFFGIPYIQSPCEAEAQCSYLNNKNYCDAIISDDSDVLVFSGKTVIKNFFNKKKTVEVYEKKAIEEKLGLYQEELINISLLCGCDYTIGVHGIGIVNALEIIKAFPNFEDLKILKDIVSNPFKKINKDKYNEEIQQFLNTHKNYKLNWIFPNNFPDREVYKCFKYPKVCTDIKKFEWHIPDINSIIKFLNKTTNISEEKVFNVLNPILQKYNVKARTYQSKIEDFFPLLEKKRKTVDDLIDKIRANNKQKRQKNKTLHLDNKISSLIDINPAGVIKSKRMTSALDHIKRRKSSNKKK